MAMKSILYNNSVQTILRSMAILSAMFLGNMSTNAQELDDEYIPFVEEGKTWYCGYWHPLENSPATFEDPLGNCIDCIFTMCGDTEINDKTYKKVYCQFKEYYGDEEQHYYCAVREEDYRVYIVEEDATEERPLYDFSHSTELILLNINDQTFARTGGYRRYNFLPSQLEYMVCHYLDDKVDYVNDTGFWVSGAGAVFNNPFTFEFCNSLFDERKFGKAISVRSCIKDGEYIFNEDWMSMPIETSINGRNYTNNSLKDVHIYDLQGRRLSAQPTKGVYIQNGKKYVVK